MKAKREICFISTFKYIFFLLIFCFNPSYASQPVWTMTPTSGSSPNQVVPENVSTTIEYLVQNQSRRPHQLAIIPTQGVTQASECVLAPKGQPGSSCILVLVVDGGALPSSGIEGGPQLCQINPDGTPNVNQCYQPAPSDTLNLRTGEEAAAQITANPLNFQFITGNIFPVTITNENTSQLAAENITATIPPGSSITVVNNNCGASLDIGDSCTISFTAISSEITTVDVSGTNTNTVSLVITAANPAFRFSQNSQSKIKFSAPDQSKKMINVSGGQLNLNICNITDNLSPAVNLNVVNSNCQSLMVDAADCMSVIPGESCNLRLSSNQPQKPCFIEIGGENTVNKIKTQLAFFYKNGIVFDYDKKNKMGYVVTDEDKEFYAAWIQEKTLITGAVSKYNGLMNSNTISMQTSCINYPEECAAQLCKNMIGKDWFLPSQDQLKNIQGQLCSKNKLPCDFGGFKHHLYWTSTELNNGKFVKAMSFPTGIYRDNLFKHPKLAVRCIKEVF